MTEISDADKQCAARVMELYEPLATQLDIAIANENWLDRNNIMSDIPMKALKEFMRCKEQRVAIVRQILRVAHM